MSNRQSSDGVACRVGGSEGVYDPGHDITIMAQPFGATGRYIATATGHMDCPDWKVMGTIALILQRAAEHEGTSRTGAPEVVIPVAEALAALKAATQKASGKPTRAEWWRRHYFEMAVREHVKLWPRSRIINPFVVAAARERKSEPATVTNLWAERLRREEAQRVEAATASAASQAERQRIAAALVEQADGQLRAAF